MSLRSPSTAYAVYVFILRDAPAIARPPPSSASLGASPGYALSPTTLGPRFSATPRFQIRTRPTLPLNGPLAGTRCFLDPCMLSAGGLLPRPQPLMVHQQAPAAEPVCDSFVCKVALKHVMAVATLRLNVVSTGLLSLTYPNDTSAPAKSPCRARTASKWGASAFESSTANLDSKRQPQRLWPIYVIIPSLRARPDVLIMTSARIRDVRRLSRTPRRQT
ncbi:hypothetical protein CPLU01_14140 [Colletotrichum plurivorum]|uniref:Uncharacterized protein n=1 Tax=Colletotrichum plurivorum TaxID=2175906 RepID=A0A8H6JM62_9PEZI|nr:hypothetical protein CPLU01_14140 [Colletotrichum plurivorum]